MIRGVPRTFYKRFTFTVEIAGIAYAGFQTCSEIRIQTAVIEHHEGGSLIPHKGLGRVTFPNVTLTRGATDDLDFYQWVRETVAVSAMLSEEAVKRTIDIVQKDRTGTEMRRWTLFDCVPVEWKAADWDNGADENVIEEVVLAYDFFEVGGD